MEVIIVFSPQAHHLFLLAGSIDALFVFRVLLVILHQLALGLILALEVAAQRLCALGLLLPQIRKLQHLPSELPLVPLVVFVDEALLVHLDGSLYALVHTVDLADMEERLD